MHASPYHLAQTLGFVLRTMVTSRCCGVATVIAVIVIRCCGVATVIAVIVNRCCGVAAVVAASQPDVCGSEGTRLRCRGEPYNDNQEVVCLESKV